MTTSTYYARNDTINNATIIVIDNESLLLNRLDIANQITTQIKMICNGKIIAVVDLLSATNLLKATHIDIVIFAFNEQDKGFLEIIERMQRWHPGVLFVAIVEDRLGLRIANRSRSHCHLHLNVSIGTPEIVRRICEETQKIVFENRVIADMNATESTGAAFRIDYHSL